MTSDDRPGTDRPPSHDPDRDPEHDGTAGTAVDDAALLDLARRGRAVLAQSDHGRVASLWDGIAAEAFGEPEAGVDGEGADPAHTGDPARPSAGDATATSGTTTEEPPEPAPSSSRGPAVDDGPGRPAEGRAADPGADVVDLGAARSRRGIGWLVGAAAAAVLVVALAGTWLASRDTAPVPIAAFELDALDDRATTVDGEIVDDGGDTRVEVDLATLPPAPAGTFYELWLLDADDGRLVSLGPVEDQSSFVVPAAVDVGDWPLLDVSVEPVDGDPTHSSDSVLRGEIVAAGPN